MQMVTVAIADTDPGRRKNWNNRCKVSKTSRCSQMLCQMEEMSGERRLKPRTDITEIEDVIARIGRLKPRILFVNLDESTGGISLCWRLYIASIPRRSWFY